jgi:hypothetical protein
VSRSVLARAAAATVATGLLLGLAACGGSDDPASDPTPTPSASSGAASASASPSESASTTDSASPTTTPATGVALEVEGIRMNAPAGWKHKRDIVRFNTSAVPPSGLGSVLLGALAFPGTPPSLDETATTSMESDGKGAKRQPDVVIGGEPFFHISMRSSKYVLTEQFGAITHGYDVSIVFDLPSTMSAAERQKTVDESIASFAWQ